MSIQNFFQSMLDRLHSSAQVRTVYGESITAAGRTVIPVARIAYGFGGGSGSRHPGQGAAQMDAEEGGGGGGGVAATPLGVVEITPEATRFIRFDDRRKLAGALAIGLLAGFWLGRRRSRGRRLTPA